MILPLTGWWVCASLCTQSDIQDLDGRSMLLGRQPGDGMMMLSLRGVSDCMSWGWIEVLSDRGRVLWSGRFQASVEALPGSQ